MADVDGRQRLPDASEERHVNLATRNDDYDDDDDDDETDRHRNSKWNINNESEDGDDRGNTRAKRYGRDGDDSQLTDDQSHDGPRRDDDDDEGDDDDDDEDEDEDDDEDDSHDGARNKKKNRRHDDDDNSQNNDDDDDDEEVEEEDDDDQVDDDRNNQDGRNRRQGGRKNDDKFRDEDDDEDMDEDEFIKQDNGCCNGCCKSCADGCVKRCPCCRGCCNCLEKCCTCLYPHGWYALLGQILAILAFIVTILGYMSCYDAEEGDHNMSFIGQELFTDRNNTYAGCLTWPHNHPPELDQAWKFGKSMDVVSMISGIICVIWIVTFACFRWAKVMRYILMALFIFTGCTAALALVAFKSKLCHTDPFHCNIVPAAVISGCAALNWFVCAFIVWHLQDPDDRDPDFDDDDDGEYGEDDSEQPKKKRHRGRPEYVIEDLPDGSRKVTKIKKRADGSEKITETIIPPEEVNNHDNMHPYPAQDDDDDDDSDDDDPSTRKVEAFQDEYPDGDDGFVTGFKPEYYHVPVQHDPESADSAGSREMSAPSESETNDQGQLLLLPMADSEPSPVSQATPSNTVVATPPATPHDLLNDSYRDGVLERPPAPSHDLLDDSYRDGVVERPFYPTSPAKAPKHPDLLDDGGYTTCEDDNEFIFDAADDNDDEDVADLLNSANQNRRPSQELLEQKQLHQQRAAQPVLQLSSPDDFRLKSDASDSSSGFPLDPPTDPRFLPPPPRLLDPPDRRPYPRDDDDDDDDDDEDEDHVPEIV